ncbi:type IV secretion system DNA-binding domain-containing protein (plasmid) [Mucilaginibacter robiniae]|uniref:Type IV secretion system DNA-binding domain-containing protein n=1 Tax=Mucilaginibacter robiniae TaxID=2728022 RepID=A0A7L5E828_9SPHI|nr:type IV secretion system DNA-binding domain-containing protein [Mucilaginibacter robiniae]QJD98547.1 type IV secretion system DNA-binding domain-containing protein [Mucilaginibacter robiniae]
MEEKKELQKLHGMLQFAVYLLVFLEIVVFVYADRVFISGKYGNGFAHLFERITHLAIYKNIFYSKFTTLIIICLVSIGTLSKKKLDLDPKKHIAYPLCFGLLLFFGSIWFLHQQGKDVFPYTSWYSIGFCIASLVGAVFIHTSMDNVSKIIHSGFGKDEWNIEGESFMQPIKPDITPYSVNIPMQFYYKKKVHNGFINVVNPFRGTILIGTPGSGKSFGVVNPFIRQMIDKGYTMCLYDFKFPDLGQIAYYHYLLAKQHGKSRDYQFNVINLDQVEKSRRINPLRADYIATLADASETAEAIVESLQKSDSNGGSEKFFTQSAVNFLASCIYFVSRHEGGKYSTFAHLLAFLNRTYEEIFTCLNTYPVLESLLSPFASALQKKAYDQLEGQIGTLKIFISRLNTEETAWVFSGDDFNLKISDPQSPSLLILANSPATQNINSTCYSVVVNRLTRLINTKGNLPTAIIADEAPTLFIHKVENLISTARSNKVAVLLGLQELPQLKQLQGKDTATTMTAVIGNVISGSVRNKETLEWLERLFGKKKQIGEGLSIDRSKTSVSLNEKYEPLIPAGKIAQLGTGELVGLLAADVSSDYNGKYTTSNIHCKVNLNLDEIKREEKNYRELPTFYDFKGKKAQTLNANFLKIRKEVDGIIEHYANLLLSH